MSAIENIRNLVVSVWRWVSKQFDVVFLLPDEKMLKPVWIATWGLICFISILVMKGIIDLSSLRTDIPPNRIENHAYTYSGCQGSSKQTESVIMNELNAQEGKQTTNQKPNSTEKCEKDRSEFVKNKRDMNAQEGMWKAAVYLVGLTAFQSFFSLIGLIFLYRTLKATRETAEIARYAERAYMFSNSLVLKKEGEQIVWIIDWDNQGNTPAMKCSLKSGWLRIESLVDIPRLKQIQKHNAAQSIGAHTGIGTRISLGSGDYLHKNIISGKRIFVWSSAFYTDVFGESRTASVCYEIIANDANTTLDIENLDFSWRFTDADWS